MKEIRVRDWRDEISGSIGYITAKLESIHEDVKETNGKVNENCKRIDALEEVNTREDAVKKFMVSVWAIIGGAVFWMFEHVIPKVFTRIF